MLPLTPVGASSFPTDRGSPLTEGMATTPAVPPSGPLTPVPLGPYGTIVPGSVVVDPAPTGTVHLVLTLGYSNATALGAFLARLSDPSSPAYHHYLTATEFDARFAPPIVTWDSVLAYVRSYGVAHLTTTPDRVMIAFDASPSTLDRMFRTTLETYRTGPIAYLAPDPAPELPRSLASALIQVDGLDTYSQHLIRTAGGMLLGSGRHAIPSEPTNPRTPSGYLPPVTVNGVQMEYAPDFQVAYDEPSLFPQYGFPTNASVATILWSGNYTGSALTTPCGTLTNGEAVGPWVPSDIYDFFNETLPSGEPHSVLTAVPINGAPAPSCLASWDPSQTNVENTLDLEMIGSTAPGAHIYNVYGPSATTANIDQAFGTILSPPATLPALVRAGLGNVTVISNSWGGTDGNDSSWYAGLEQAQARGISVLASSGDSGDNPASSMYIGTTVEFPASMAYNTFGDTAVGGTTVALNPATLHLASQIVWNISAADVVDGGPAGSTGGVSAAFPEPSWQASSSANAVIRSVGSGRGVPDIAAIANNTLMTITLDGFQYRATNASLGGRYVSVWGTSIASPLTAGEVAEIDHVLVSSGNPVLGFLNPALYALASMQYAPLPRNATGVGAVVTGAYAYSLPTVAFDDVTVGQNDRYPALPGYDLVTGWGSLDAYNVTMYELRVSSAGLSGHLSGIQDRLNLTGLAVTSTGGSYNASLQQNFFLANSLGAPVYWVQNVVYLAGGHGNWQMTFTGWVIFPFFPSYPADSVREFNVPASSLAETTPINFNLTTQLENPNSLRASMVFSFGVSGATPLTLPVPGASFLIGSLDYPYSWQGVNYSNGGIVRSGGPGFLSPQFGLVGGPSSGVGDFETSTAGALSVYLAPWGTSSWQAADTETFGLATAQTGETARNLSFTRISASSWTLGVQSGGTTQGVLGYEAPPGPSYTVRFNETGVPATASWWVNISGGPSLAGSGTNTSLSTSLPSGSYPWTAAIGPRNWTFRPDRGTATVASGPVYVDLVAVPPPTYSVSFQEQGLPTGTSWSVTFAGSLKSSTGTLIFFTAANGSYPFSAGAVSGYTASPAYGTVDVVGGQVIRSIAFSPVTPAGTTYPVTFAESGLPVGTTWSVTLNGTTLTSSSTTVVFFETNGVYAFSVGAVSNYTSNLTSGHVTVSGAPTTTEVGFSPTSGGGGGSGAGGAWSLFGLTLDEWLLLGIGILVIVAIGVLADRRRRKR